MLTQTKTGQKVSVTNVITFSILVVASSVVMASFLAGMVLSLGPNKAGLLSRGDQHVQTGLLQKIPGCYDTDGGRNYEEQGKVREISKIKESKKMAFFQDECIGANMLNEYYCNARRQAVLDEHNCPYGCEDRECSLDWQVFLEEDFDDGSASWEPDSRWFIEDGALTSDSFAYTSFGSSDWSNYSFEVKVKLEQGVVILYTRTNPQGAYGARIGGNHLVLWKDTPEAGIDLESEAYDFEIGRYYKIKIKMNGQNIKVYVDENLVISYTDTENPFLLGGVALENIEKAYLDDVLIKGETLPIHCGNGICEEGLGEDEETCPQDCLVESSIQGYYDYMTSHPELWQEITKAELDYQIDQARQFLDQEDYLTSEDIIETIIETLNIEPLMSGIESRPLEVNVISITETENYIQKELTFNDSEVGQIKALLLLPKIGSAPYPAIVGLHGHGDFAETFRDEYFGASLAEEGFAVIMPDLRAMFCDAEQEEIVAKDMLIKGFSLMGMRVYEAHLMAQYIKHEGLAEPENIGLIGHSGGSSTSNLAVRLDDSFAAVIVDLESDYLNLCEEKVHCETIPRLSRYSEQINDRSTLAIPWLQFEYGFPDPDDEQEVIDFFRANLF